MTELSWILMGALMAGGLVSFFMEWPLCKEFFMKDLYEGQEIPWWYAETVRYKAGSCTYVMIPFHLVARWGWRFFHGRWRWNYSDRPDSYQIQILEMRCAYLTKELKAMIKNRDEAVLRCWELEEMRRVQSQAARRES